jgi:NADPH-dependent 2,4-dienoyl-CoA reductase/sulfur reductase-like enzyme
MSHIVIIGNGISGVSAARHVRKLGDHKITLISSETLMYIYMGHMKFEHTKPYEDWFWEKNKIDLVQAHVNEIGFSNKTLILSNSESIKYDKLVLALGSKPNKFGWPGQELKGVQGLYSYQDLLKMEESSIGLKKAVIIGGGLIGVEMAEMFHSRHIDVTFLVREASFWSNVLPEGESGIINNHLLENNIDLRLNEELHEIKGNENGEVESIITKSGKEIKCGFVGLTAGVSPNVEFLKNSELNINRGIQVNLSFETNIKDVYAIGDCAEFITPPPGRRSIEQVWYTGRMHGEVLAYNLYDKTRNYNPGPWFNSAKFFEIEYQTYGMVSSNYLVNEAGIYWEDELKEKCIHIVFDKKSFEIIGVNLFGIRHRHKVWDKWLRENRKVNYVLENLQKANFDPEFFAECEIEIVEIFNSKYPSLAVTMKRKKRFLEKLGIK